ncbi:MAG: hypothetical protein LBF89_09355 [Bacteroidales bacterium]|jgi:hypothetical protein|nr:hypothetical protein [Bacteroidales bacterium]
MVAIKITRETTAPPFLKDMTDFPDDTETPDEADEAAKRKGETRRQQ